MEVGHQPFIGGKEIPILFTEQRIYERDLDIDSFTESRLNVYRRFIDVCQKISLSPDPNSPRALVQLSEDDQDDYSHGIKVIAKDVEEMSGFFRYKDDIYEGKAHGTYQEIFSRLATLGVLVEMPTFENSKNYLYQKDFVDFSQPDKYILHLPFCFTHNPTDIDQENRECSVSINRTINFDEASKKLAEIKAKHQKQLEDFRAQHGVIKVKEYKDSKGNSRYYKTMPVAQAIKEASRR